MSGPRAIRLRSILCHKPFPRASPNPSNVCSTDGTNIQREMFRPTACFIRVMAASVAFSWISRARLVRAYSKWAMACRPSAPQKSATGWKFFIEFHLFYVFGGAPEYRRGNAQLQFGRPSICTSNPDDADGLKVTLTFHFSRI